jgi:3'(2'), 5'-bisphosphate nucleotidase
MLSRELEAAVAMAREAGEILLEIYATDFSVEMKGRADPVTEADRRVNELLVRRIQEAFPDDAIVAEESPDNRASAAGRCWYVDPLDGTKEFVARNGEFSVMIGLAIDGEARLGVVHRARRARSRHAAPPERHRRPARAAPGGLALAP